MKATVWFRISATILLLFAVGHTVGFLSFRGDTPDALAVRTQMDAARFAAAPGGAPTPSFGGFYVGFGLSISAFYVFIAWVAWRLGAMARRGSTDVAALGWPMVVVMVINAGLAVRYFFGPPIVISIVTTACLLTGTIMSRAADTR